MPESLEAAVYWLHKAAAQGEAWAQLELGIARFQGSGIKQDFEEALKWYLLARRDEASREAAEANIAQVQARLTRRQIARAERLAEAWTPAME